MKIIALRGNENSGKSHTINVVYYLLLNRRFTQVPGYYRELGNPIYEDILDVLESEGKETKVGIVGMGDYQRGDNGVASLIQVLIQAGCNVIVCACTNKPGIVNSLSKFTNITFIDKTITTESNRFRIVNVIDAQKIDALI